MKKKVLILDLDGTLYFKFKVQLVMGLYLLIYYFFHFWKLKELSAILGYRKYREEKPDTSIIKQYKVIAKKYKLSVDRVEYITKEWLIYKPLKILNLFKDKKLIKIINEAKEKEIKIIIYSDYPTYDKLKAMNINYDKAYDPTNKNIKYLKPNPKGLEFIIKENNLKKEDILYIGDRDSKDGECARKCNIDYIILSKFFRSQNYKLLEFYIKI